MKQKSIDELLAGWREFAAAKQLIGQQANGFNHNVDENYKPPYNPDKLVFSEPITKPEALASAIQAAEAKRWEYTAVEVAIKGAIAGWGDDGRRIALAYCSRGAGSSTIAEACGIKRHYCSAVIKLIKDQAPAAYEGIRAAHWLRQEAA